MLDMATAYAQIIKSELQADGTLMVYGKATDDSLDVDQQICDAAWLDRAMPDWFKSGGNIREQHSNIAAGVAKEYESKTDGHYINALVVDPVSVKKVETGVLKGFSIGIKSPRVVRDNKAVNGRIIDGQIVEVSLVDRPANPNAKLMLAKSVDGEESLVKVEEMVEEQDTNLVKEMGDGIPVAGEAKALPSREELTSRYAEAKKALDDVTAMCKECGYEDIMKQYGESAEEETAEGANVSASTAQEEVSEAQGGMSTDKSVHKCLECGCGVPQATHGLTEVPAVAGQITGNEMANVSTAAMFSPDETPVMNANTGAKSADPEETPEDSSTEKVEEKASLPESVIADILEKAVKSAKESVQTEIDIIKSAKEAVENELTSVKTDLAKAQSLAIGGGPKRTVLKTVSAEPNDDARLANEYFAKAAATTDKELAKGYRELAQEFLVKSQPKAE
jgi:hypothetical protein